MTGAAHPATRPARTALPPSLAAVLALVPALAAADPVVLRLATSAPDGTLWAREFKAFARDVALGTRDEVRVKWYLGGVAGDELQAAERVRRDQLDGVGSGGMLCTRLAPSMRLTRIPGLFQTREESAYVLGQLKPLLDEEFARAGFANLLESGVGPEVLFSAAPITSMAELRTHRVWIWDLDDLVLGETLRDMGVTTVPLPLEVAHRAYDEGRVDAFVSPPIAALAFQWSTQVRHFSELRVGFLSGCLLIANRAFDALPVDSQQALRSAAARLRARLEEDAGRQDSELLGRLFERQGLRQVPATSTMRTEFLEAARASRERLGERFAPRELLDRAARLIAEHRSAHNLATGKH